MKTKSIWQWWQKYLEVIWLMKTANAPDQWFSESLGYNQELVKETEKEAPRVGLWTCSGPREALLLCFTVQWECVRVYIYILRLQFVKKKILKTTVIYICYSPAHKENWNQDIWDKKALKFWKNDQFSSDLTNVKVTCQLRYVTG